MYSCRRYKSELLHKWNDFLTISKNQTFLFNRNFMDYHSDKFEDYSLMIFEDDTLVSVLPANIVNNELFSHQGLTFGGFVFQRDEKLLNIFGIVKSALQYLTENGISSLYYKLIPRFYNTIGADEIDYAMFILNAELYRRDSALCISLDTKLNYQNRRIRSIKKALASGVEIREDKSFNDFWNNILIPNLKERFGVLPVHSLEEINKLGSNFPANIKQYNAYFNGELIAGTTIFETDTVAHAQYISSSQFGRNSGGLDLLFHHLINDIYKDKKYFDFGISNEDNGRKINQGLLEWKEGFGGRSFSHDFYKIQCHKYPNLDTVKHD